MGNCYFVSVLSLVFTYSFISQAWYYTRNEWSEGLPRGGFFQHVLQCTPLLLFLPCSLEASGRFGGSFVLLGGCLLACRVPRTLHVAYIENR